MMFLTMTLKVILWPTYRHRQAHTPVHVKQHKCIHTFIYTHMHIKINIKWLYSSLCRYNCLVCSWRLSSMCQYIMSGIPWLRPRDEKELTRVPSRGGHASCSASAKYVGVRICGASVQVPVRRNRWPAERTKGNPGRNECRDKSIWM